MDEIGITRPGPGPGRAEDRALVTGHRAFTADLGADDALHAVFVRSPVANGRLVEVDARAAAAHPGVVAVETGQTSPLGPFHLFGDLPASMCGPPLARDRVRFVGEAIAVVVARDVATATDAADLVDVEIETSDSVLDPLTSAAAPPLYPESGTNVVYQLIDGGADPIGPEAVHVVEAVIVNNRVASAPLECDGILATPLGDGLDVWCTSQGVQGIRDQLAPQLGIDAHRIRVRSPAVGGGFGGRGSISPEFVVVCDLARRLGRPVRWLQGRYENLTGMAQGRGYHTAIRVGFDEAGHITGMDVDVTADAGASAHLSALLLISARRQFPGMYRTPRYRCSARAVLTNTTPVGAYRGAGQPEANHARERLLDLAAAELGMDPIELRLRNLASADEFPLVSASGPGFEAVVYDRADPQRAMQRSLELADVAGWRAEQQRRRDAGARWQIGIGIGNYAQTSGRGAPRDSALVQVRADGSVLIGCASPSHGQGHLTTWSALVARELGIDPSLIAMVDADTDVVASGQTTGGSRSTQVAASALVHACEDLVAAARPLVASELEAAESDLVVAPAGHGMDAGLAVAGVPTRRVTWAQLAGRSERNCLEATRNESVSGAAHPYGSHVTVVEVDNETGAVRLLSHAAVDDCGRVLQPTLVEGQQHGGAVAGLGQALFEDIGYDVSGNPMSATFASYLLPAASELCSIETETLGTVTERNPLGTRGIGENGCNAATASAHNAVLDALADTGIRHLDLPLTPEKIWQSITGRTSNGPMVSGLATSAHYDETDGSTATDR